MENLVPVLFWALFGALALIGSIELVKEFGFAVTKKAR